MKKNNQEKTLLSQESYDSLKNELDNLQDGQLPAVVERIAKAREQGDLSENSEYKDAKDQQELLEVRIGEIKEILAKAQIMSGKERRGDGVGVGSRVNLEDERGKKAEFVLVGEFDAAASEANTISTVSVLGGALLGKKVGDEVKVSVPAGEKVWKINKIS